MKPDASILFIFAVLSFFVFLVFIGAYLIEPKRQKLDKPIEYIEPIYNEISYGEK